MFRDFIPGFLDTFVRMETSSTRVMIHVTNLLVGIEVDRLKARGLVVTDGAIVLKWKLMSCSHGQEFGQFAVLASNWLFTLVQPIRSHLAC